MPANPYKDQQRAFASIKATLAEETEGISRRLLVSEVLAKYPVGRRSVEQFIDDRIAAGVVIDDEGVLRGSEVRR